MKRDIKVGIADYKISKAPNRIITRGLGSCVGITIYDRYNDIGGLAHIMLPDSSQFRDITKPEKFADLAIPKMAHELIDAGLVLQNMVAKVAGGANMFQFQDKRFNMDIGKRNIIAVRDVLKRLGIQILAEDTGGSLGRTMVLDLECKTVNILTLGESIKVL